jgi:SAM-dependent methyltransferase
MARADLFIILDHVQFERRNYQNRTMIRLEDESRWLTVPVMQVSQKERIVEKQVDNSEGGSRAWGPTHFKTLKYAYRKAPYFELYAPRLQQILEARWDKLIDLDLAMLDFLREAFEIRTPLKRSSEMRAEGARSQLLLNLCKEVGPRSTFFGGLGGSRHYLDHDAFRRRTSECNGRSSAIPRMRSAARGPSFQASCHWTSFSTAGRRAVICSGSARRPSRRSALQPELQTARWYEDKVRRFGYDHRGLGFRTRTSQEKRFEALLALGDFDGRRLLDVGCGFGDFLAFLHARGIHPEYTGIDLCEPMVARGRERFNDGAQFIVSDVLEYLPSGGYDYVVASGIFGLEAEGARDRIQPTLERMFEWAQRGAAANFLSALSPVPVEQRVYIEPVEMLEFALSITPAVRLDHSYLPNDFTIHLYKTPAWEPEPRTRKS